MRRPTPTPDRVLIVGDGFGGRYAAKALGSGDPWLTRTRRDGLSTHVSATSAVELGAI